ncbi:S8 family serine peptidase, partial [Xanthomonas bonasiae]|uniref:S8 family serine peptidase n=1 Tax=Xanthomonas bonasiae TaxID=2810351 RepID=UPI001981E0E9
MSIQVARLRPLTQRCRSTWPARLSSEREHAQVDGPVAAGDRTGGGVDLLRRWRRGRADPQRSAADLAAAHLTAATAAADLSPHLAADLAATADPDYYYGSGTSFAAPLVSGAAA